MSGVSNYGKDIPANVVGAMNISAQQGINDIFSMIQQVKASPTRTVQLPGSASGLPPKENIGNLKDSIGNKVDKGELLKNNLNSTVKNCKPLSLAKIFYNDLKTTS